MQSQQVVYVQVRMPGMIVATFGCVFGILGILSVGMIFFWFALACCIIGLFRARGAAIGVNILGIILTVFAFATSPGVWLQIAVMMTPK